MGSPYPLHYTVRWPYYYLWPSTKNHSNIKINPISQQFIPVNDNEHLTAIFCGDIMLTQHDRVPKLHASVISLINKADYFVGNCEAPLGKHPINADKKYHLIYHMPQRFLEGILQQINLPPNQCILSVANNHAGDKGQDAFLESMRLLKRMGVVSVGDIQNADLPIKIIEKNNTRLGIVSWTHWMNREVFSRAHNVGRIEQIHKVNWAEVKKCYHLDTLIGLPHWEYEFQHFPKLKTRHLAQRLIEYSGFNLLVGSHPHTLQPMEKFENGICAYSLGNFCGLGMAWPVRLIPLLEVKIGTTGENRGQILSYQLHTFAQVNYKESMEILPLDQIPVSLKSKLLKRLAMVYKITA